MCQFKSGLVFRGGELFTSPFTDAHEDLIALRGLTDYCYAVAQNWIRVEYTPDEKFLTWTLNVDESQTPAWFDEDTRAAVIAKFERLIAAMTVRSNRSIVVGEEVIVAAGGIVERLVEARAIVLSGGTVTANRGTVTANYGTVTANRGTVTANYGTVTENHGTVTKNHSGGTVTKNHSGGTVTVNCGTVTDNRGTVTENCGTVAANYGTVTENRGTVNGGKKARAKR